MVFIEKRKHWLQKIENAWKEKSIVWLRGVRRSGKTTLCKSIPGVELFDCELPRVRRSLEDPESFFSNLMSKTIALDEIHRLDNPSEVLKIAADYFPKLRVIATGSSTLGAHKKFKDTLTDRKREVWLTPMNSKDLDIFDHIKTNDRLLKGGLPGFSLKPEYQESDFKDWVDSFWAKDVQSQFSIRKSDSFLKFFELLALQSGGLFEAQSFAAPCGVSHNTINSFVNVLELTNVALRLRPYSKNKNREITSASKIFFFDTGFISYFHGWTELHSRDLGYLWEHLALNELLYTHDIRDIHHWRDKAKNEIDFVIKTRGKEPIAIECKWKAENFNPKCLYHFRSYHPGTKNYVVAEDVSKPYVKKIGEHKVTFVGLSQLSEVGK
ncbi:MAG: DUF4143 domain-containing protein [Oligoflexia bacterium]|nr:DUF4143 domain-containing protein [Oligoflexia bacterium]